MATKRTSTLKDFTQVALDVLARATGSAPASATGKTPLQKQTAPQDKGAVKKAGKRT